MKSSFMLVGLISSIAGAMAVPTENHTVPGDVAEIRFASMIPGTLLCIEDKGGLRTPGNPVQLAECNFDKVREQQWYYNNDIYTIQLSPSRSEIAYCLDVQDDSGTHNPDITIEPDVVVNPCDDTPTQKWHLVQDQESDTIFKIRNDETSTCLEAVEGDEQGYQLTHNLCKDQVGQQWTDLE